MAGTAENESAPADARTGRVETTPLPTGANYPPSVEQLGDEVFLVRLPLGIRWLVPPVGVLLSAIGVGAVVLAASDLWRKPFQPRFWEERWFWCLILMAFPGLYGSLPCLLLPWVRLDRLRGELSYRSFWSWRAPTLRVQRRPLRDIRAVQMLYAGIDTDEDGGRYPVYQLNLVLDDAPPQRVNVGASSEPEWVRQTGRQLATFLAVPLLDQMEAYNEERNTL